VTNLEKMNEIVGENADKKKVIDWAYMNRVHVVDLPNVEPFEEMKNSVDDFYESEDFINNVDDEFKLWDKFLDRDFIE
jgi:hypothetical protein